MPDAADGHTTEDTRYAHIIFFHLELRLIFLFHFSNLINVSLYCFMSMRSCNMHRPQVKDTTTMLCLTNFGEVATTSGDE